LLNQPFMPPGSGMPGMHSAGRFPGGPSFPGASDVPAGGAAFPNPHGAHGAGGMPNYGAPGMRHPSESDGFSPYWMLGVQPPDSISPHIAPGVSSPGVAGVSAPGAPVM